MRGSILVLRAEMGPRYNYIMSKPCFGLKGTSSDCAGKFDERDFLGKPADLILQCRKCGSCNPAHVYQNAARIDLTDEEMNYAREIGLVRNRDAKRLGLPDKHGFSGQGDNIHALGASAELAFARFCGVPWEATNLTFKAPDVGSVQVRGRSLRGYDLIIREDDDLEAPFVLVVGRNPFYIMGWIIGSEAAQEDSQTYGGREKARFVRAAKLRDPRTVPIVGIGA